MRQPAAAPLDHFCILFLREKDVPARHERRSHPPAGGRHRAVVSIATQLRASRTVPAAKPHCGVVRDTFACVAAVVLAKPWPRLPRRQARRLPLDAPYKQGVFQGGEAAMGRLRRIPRRAVLEERTWP